MLLSATIAASSIQAAEKKKKDNRPEEEATVETVEIAPGVMSVVSNPDVPLSMKFCGQDVDLDPVYMFERMDRELTSLCYTHGSTLLAIKRANRYFPMIREILKKNGVPEDMVYLACTESTLDPFAISPAKAAGLWQFMPDTGRQYGLEVNEYVDERFHPVKSTEAACKYLLAAYKKYGKWESVASSYNAGMGRISNELRNQGVDSSWDLWLVNETTRYPFRIIAYKLILEDPAKYGFNLAENQLYQPLNYQVVKVDKPIESWSKWAADHDITYRDLREANPWIRANYLTNKSGKVYEVLVPDKEKNKRSKL